MTYFSIITPLFNKANYISETISSVRDQKMTNWEMIIVDNGSTDHGPAIARQYAGLDSRINFIEFSRKQGPGAARNAGLYIAIGQWVVFLDSDDLIQPDFLAHRYEIATRNNDVQIIVGKWEEFEDITPEKRVEKYPTQWLGDTSKIVEAAIAYAPWALHAAIVRRDFLMEKHQWVEELDQFASEDTAFWFRVIQDAKIEWCNNSGALYRVHTFDSRNAIRDPVRWITSVTRIIENNFLFLQRCQIEPTRSQYENTFRVLESLYRLAIEYKLQEEQIFLEKQIFQFMKLAPLSIGIITRRLLGLKFFNLMRYAIK
ncbi:glycosyltransferase family 2 protein [Cylindrospermopsis raciborskii G7]|uniref:glycosyltransferase family 2 protein n=1 Tax=Cylindrospermopsis raciborskii TaxID=77022 RepID=UPI003EBF9EEF